MMRFPGSWLIHGVLAGALLLASCGGEESVEVGALSSALRGDGTPVRLLHAKATLDYAANCQTPQACGYAYGYVEVKNLAYQKTVVVHYTTSPGASTPWKDQPATYVGPSLPGYEIWTFRLPTEGFYAGGGLNTQLAIRLAVAGQTYWANNEGRDYRVAIGTRPTFPLVDLDGSDVVLRSVETFGGRMVGKVTLKNLAYQKQVKIVWSTDSWKTVHESLASYAGSSCGCMDYRDFNDLENWGFDVALPTGAKQVKLAVSYTPGSSSTIWDNNFGKDYTVAVPGRFDF